MQRMADVAEAVAKDYLQLQTDLEFYKKTYREKSDEIKIPKNSNRGLKGHITRLKSKLDVKFKLH
jgi:hypothetical protein